MSYPNTAARTVEDAAVGPLRNTLLQVNGLTNIQSRSRDESAVLYLYLPLDTDPDLAFIEVNEKIDRAMNQLPRELDRPRVLATDVSDIPVVQLSVTLRDTTSGGDLLEISKLARQFRRFRGRRSVPVERRKPCRKRRRIIMLSTRDTAYWLRR